jgi:hypothetical protein
MWATGVLLSSLATGVGHKPRSTIRTWCSNPTCRFLPSGIIPVGVISTGLTLPPFGTFGVCHNPHSVSSVRGILTASRNNKRLPGVPDVFQVRKHLVEAHADVPSNIFTNEPIGPELMQKAMHLRPEVTVILFACSLPGKAEGLARVSAANNVNWFNIASFQGSHVLKDRHPGEILSQHLLRERLNLAKCHRLNLAGPVCRERKSADS